MTKAERDAAAERCDQMIEAELARIHAAAVEKQSWQVRGGLVK